MSKIIIDNQADISNFDAINMVKRVIGMGFISGENQYCWVSTFKDDSNEWLVQARKTRVSKEGRITHSFKVTDAGICNGKETTN